jgi:hypothetical protein
LELQANRSPSGRGEAACGSKTREEPFSLPAWRSLPARPAHLVCRSALDGYRDPPEVAGRLPDPRSPGLQPGAGLLHLARVRMPAGIPRPAHLVCSLARVCCAHLVCRPALAGSWARPGYRDQLPEAAAPWIPRPARGRGEAPRSPLACLALQGAPRGLGRPAASPRPWRTPGRPAASPRMLKVCALAPGRAWRVRHTRNSDRNTLGTLMILTITARGLAVTARSAAACVFWRGLVRSAACQAVDPILEHCRNAGRAPARGHVAGLQEIPACCQAVVTIRAGLQIYC